MYQIPFCSIKYDFSTQLVDPLHFPQELSYHQHAFVMLFFDHFTLQYYLTKAIPINIRTYVGSLFNYGCEIWVFHNGIKMQKNTASILEKSIRCKKQKTKKKQKQKQKTKIKKQNKTKQNKNPTNSADYEILNEGCQTVSNF